MFLIVCCCCHTSVSICFEFRSYVLVFPSFTLIRQTAALRIFAVQILFYGCRLYEDTQTQKSFVNEAVHFAWFLKEPVAN